MAALRTSVCTLLACSALFLLPQTSAAESYEQAERKTLHELRLLRIQIFDTFRTNRAEYNRRRAAAEQTWNAWHKAGGDPAQSEKLVNWMRHARRASHFSAPAALPRTPEFMFVARPLPVPAAGQQQLVNHAKPSNDAVTESKAKEQNAVRGVGRALKRSMMIGAILPWGG